MPHHPSSTRCHLIRPAVALGMVTALSLTACSDDEPETSRRNTAQASTDAGRSSSGEPSSDGEAFCDAYLAVSTDQGPDIDFEAATDDQIGEAMAAYATAFEPKLDALAVVAPTEASEAVDTYTGTYREILETGDDSAFDDAYLAAERVIVDAAIESCAVETVDATAVDYAYQGIPGSVREGRVGFRLANEGTNVHEAVILRRADGDTTPVAEILAMTEEEQAGLAEFVGVAFVAPGSEGAVLLDLTPGEYIVVCNLPVGMTGVDAEVEGTPHHTEGMISEFSVG